MILAHRSENYFIMLPTSSRQLITHSFKWKCHHQSWKKKCGYRSRGTRLTCQMEKSIFSKRICCGDALIISRQSLWKHTHSSNRADCTVIWYAQKRQRSTHHTHERWSCWNKKNAPMPKAFFAVDDSHARCLGQLFSERLSLKWKSHACFNSILNNKTFGTNDHLCF